MGSQWKTTGGSFGFLNNTWFNTFKTTANATNATKAALMTSPRPCCVTSSERGVLIDSRIPILLGGAE